MYEEVLAKLESESDRQSESQPQPQATQSLPPQVKPNKPQPESEKVTDKEVKEPTSALATEESSTQQSGDRITTNSANATNNPEKLESFEKASTQQSGDRLTAHSANVTNDLEKSKGKSEESETPNYFFQAIGIIKGVITLTEERSTIQMGNKQYQLYYIPNKRKRAYEALKQEIESTGNSTQRLIVYPKILHFPKKEQPHKVGFQVVGFISDKSAETPLNQELQEGEFKFSGLWQFIPVCRNPCISIFRNFNKERLSWIKEAEAHRKYKFMKASHIPMLWKDSPVRPFRFNPKLEKEQQAKTYFVQVKAKFLPGRDVFGFIEQLAEPTEDAPRFLKASKKVKAEALKEAKERKQQQKTDSKKTTPRQTASQS